MVVHVLQFRVARLSGRKDGHPNRPATPINFRTLLIGDSKMKQNKLTQGKVALIDDDDFKRVSQHKWCAQKRPNTFYAVAGIKSSGKWKTIKMHRLLMDVPKDMDVDHRDGNGLNNQRPNLRICTRSQNCMNRRKQKGSSRYKGVCRHKLAKKWMASIMIDGKPIHLGLFKSEYEAAKAYDKAAIKHFGEYAKLNIIPERA